MPQQLVKLRPSKFIQDVLNTYCARLDKFWTPEQVEELETNHRDLVETYGGDVAVREAIDKHEAHTLFNDGWDVLLVQNDFAYFAAAKQPFPPTRHLSKATFWRSFTSAAPPSWTFPRKEFTDTQRAILKQLWDQ